MATQGKKHSINKPSIKYRHLPLESASYEFANIRKDRNACVRTDSQPENCKQSVSVPTSFNNILRTSEFVSVVGGIWNSLNQPCAIFQPTHHAKDTDFQDENSICYSDDATSEGASTSSEYFTVGSSSPENFHPQVNSDLEHLKSIQRRSLLKPCTRYNNEISSFGGFKWPADSHSHLDSWWDNGPANVGLFYDLRSIYQCIFVNPFYSFKDLVKLTQNECKEPAEDADLEKKATLAHYILPGNMGCKSNDLPNVAKHNAFVGGQHAEPLENLRQSFIPLYTSYLLGSATKVEASAISIMPNSVFHSEYQIKFLDLAQSMVVENSEVSSTLQDKSWLHDEKKEFEGPVLEDRSSTDLCLSMQNKSADVVAKQSHAIAGALAGTVVSLCLHPFDTVKTVIQAHNRDPKSISSIFRSIVSERGITGLYRGIMSNIASSAPISAVYTFTYEYVKGAMLPFLPKEYHSFAHCTAGGCASIATSFIFTPSERIKQQMQVGSHYQSCWMALVKILEGGGLSSLYAGWVAVLCRNIPHSVIKFYTYESLKQWMLSSPQSNGHPNSLQTLICGGLAACTAALFTTPFDVVKTRLQTQIPGSLSQYDGVLHTLQDIAKREGLKGLYRGLTPRLMMYMSQGAIFFASYESFKMFFAFELPHLPVQIDGQNADSQSKSSTLHGLRS